VTEGFVEHLSILNHADTPKSMQVRIAVDADFADLFEVKDVLRKKGEHYRRVEDGHLVLGYRRDDYKRETWIGAPGAVLDEAGLSFHVELPPHGQWSTSIAVEARALTVVLRKNIVAKQAGKPRHADADAVIAAAPRIVTSWLPLVQTYHRSLVDLAALRFFPLIAEG